MIKQKKLRQSNMNENEFLKYENPDPTNQNNSVDNFNPAIEGMFPLENNIDLENINTSTFGYAIKHNNRETQQNRNDNTSLKNSNGILSTVNSKMSKRYVTNQLTESDSSCGDNMMQGKFMRNYF